MTIAFLLQEIERCIAFVSPFLCHRQLGVKPKEIGSEPVLNIVMNNADLSGFI
jgi:hypothetical protein